MATHCTRCHASSLSGPDRNGAPAFHDFDSLNGILAVADHVDWTAGASADGLIVNDSMPKDDETEPTVAERQQLAEWLACELAR